MKTFDMLTDDQQDAIDRLYFQPHTMLLCSMGGGKTVVTLTAISEMLEDDLIERVLIVAPLKVCREVWAKEHEDWGHLQHLDVDLALGTAKQREKAYQKMGKLVVTNFENLRWASKAGYLDQFDALLIDESTKAKSYGEVMKALRFKLKLFKWRAVMTGTLLSENLDQIFYQQMIVDRGAALGTVKEKFLREFFYPTDYQQRSWEPKSGSLEKITERVAGTIYTMPDYRGTLPPLHIHDIPVDIGAEGWSAYLDMANTFESQGVLAETAAAKQMKLEQVANGFMYDDDEVVWVHDAKIETLENCFQKRGKSFVTQFDYAPKVPSLLIVYQFEEDLARLRDLYPDGQCLNDGADVVDQWNSGALPVLFIHPKSGGHGLNLAAGGCFIVWFSPVWSRDLWLQTVARLWRRGQSHAVHVWRLMATGTVDHVKVDRVDGKGETQALFDAHMAGLRVGQG